MKALSIFIIALIPGGGASLLALYYQAQPRQEIVSGLEDAGSLPAIFENATNLTNNEQDSVYGEVAAWNSSVYVVWQDSIIGRNYDIFMKKSADNGTTFGEPVNISNNAGFSEHPQVSTYGRNVYTVWADNTYGDREVLFARSIDGGTSFENPRILSNDTLDSHNQEIAAFGDRVYVVWIERDEEENTSVLFSASDDGGATFSKLKISSKANAGTFPKAAAYGDNVYVTWNVAGDDGLYFAKSSNMGSTFGSVTKLEIDGSGESQVAAYYDTVYIIAGGLDSEKVGGLFFIKSVDGGRNFADPVLIDADGKFVNPLNVEIAADNHEVSYVAGQVLSGDNEEIFLLQVTGNNATGVVNLSKNPKVSECPSIALVGEKIYVVWEDLTPGNHEVLYAKGVKT